LQVRCLLSKQQAAIVNPATLAEGCLQAPCHERLKRPPLKSHAPRKNRRSTALDRFGRQTYFSDR
jgi:hypothetical protein